VNIVEESRQVLKQLVPRLEAEGYTVYLQPSRHLLPSFMEGYIPDAIALGPNKNLAIEVIVEGPSSKPKADRIKHRFEEVKDWELRVYYVRPTNRTDALQAMTKETIDSSISSVETLVSEGETLAALLIGWATFEALGRALSPDKFARPQSPARLIEVLATDGLITPSEADFLRTLASARNELIHGILDQSVDMAQLSKFIDILKMLSGMKQPITA
jgi:REase_AHJR-like protein